MKRIILTAAILIPIVAAMIFWPKPKPKKPDSGCKSITPTVESSCIAGYRACPGDICVPACMPCPRR